MSRPLSIEAMNEFVRDPTALLNYVLHEMGGDNTSAVSLEFVDRVNRTHFMQALYNARREDRRRSKAELKRDDPNWGKSLWEAIRFSTERGANGTYVLVVSNKTLEAYSVVGGEVR